MAVIDFIFIGIIILFAVIGVIKGFIDNLFGKLSWILGLIFAFFFYDTVARNALSGLKNQIVANILAFIIIFIIVFLIVKMVQVILSKINNLPILNSLDRALGFLFGIVEGIAVVTLIIFILCNQPFFSIENIFNGSFFFDLFNKFLPMVDFSEIKELKKNV